jgi:hypothetical protein
LYIGYARMGKISGTYMQDFVRRFQHKNLILASLSLSLAMWDSAG